MKVSLDVKQVAVVVGAVNTEVRFVLEGDYQIVITRFDGHMGSSLPQALGFVRGLGIEDFRLIHTVARFETEVSREDEVHAD